MSKKEEDNDGNNCGIIIGLVIVSIAVGNIWSAVYGWLTLGAALLFLGLLGTLLNRRK